MQLLHLDSKPVTTNTQLVLPLYLQIVDKMVILGNESLFKWGFISSADKWRHSENVILKVKRHDVKSRHMFACKVVDANYLDQ